MWWLIIGGLVLAVVLVLIIWERSNRNETADQVISYQAKPFLTAAEKDFLAKLKPLMKEGYLVIPQVNLATVIAKTGQFRWQTELYRNIDFGIFDQDYNLKLLIELNDFTHQSETRRRRDQKVWRICQTAGLKLMTFYTNQPNRPDYVVQRVRGELG